MGSDTDLCRPHLYEAETPAAACPAISQANHSFHATTGSTLHVDEPIENLLPSRDNIHPADEQDGPHRAGRDVPRAIVDGRRGCGGNSPAMLGGRVPWLIGRGGKVDLDPSGRLVTKRNEHRRLKGNRPSV